MLLSADNCSGHPQLVAAASAGNPPLWRQMVPPDRPGGSRRRAAEGQPAEHGALGAAGGALGADPPGPESVWLRASGKHTQCPWRVGGWIGAGGNRAGPVAALRGGESQASASGPEGPGSLWRPSQGQTRWLLTVRAPGSSWRPGQLVSHPCSEHPRPRLLLSPITWGLGLQVGTPVIQAPHAPPVPQPQTVWDTLTPERPPVDLGVCGGQGPRGCQAFEVSFQNSSAFRPSPGTSP